MTSGEIEIRTGHANTIDDVHHGQPRAKIKRSTIPADNRPELRHPQAERRDADA
jgi:hypothetical protein